MFFYQTKDDKIGSLNSSFENKNSDSKTKAEKIEELEVELSDKIEALEEQIKSNNDLTQKVDTLSTQNKKV